MTLTFKTKKHLEMGLPIGAVSPIDFGKHQGDFAYVLENDVTYRISNKAAETAKASEEAETCKATK